MQFTNCKRRQTPTIILVSLIDVLIVVLIFLMVSTTFKRQPSFKLALAESKEAKTDGGASEGKPLTVTIPKTGPVIFNELPVTFPTLEKRLKEAVAANPHVKLVVDADADAPMQQFVNVNDAALAAKIEAVSMNVKKTKSSP